MNEERRGADAPTLPDPRRRVAAAVAILTALAALAALAVGLVRSFPQGPSLVLMVVLAGGLGLDGLRRRGASRRIE